MTKQIKVKNVLIGGGAPITVQTMTTTKTTDLEATKRQIEKIALAGCDIVRVAVNVPAAVEPFGEICRWSPIPVVADIHYDAKLALAAIEQGAAKIRLNPGNTEECLMGEIARRAKQKGIPVRIGVNMGSLDPVIEKEYGRTANGMVYSALKAVKVFTDNGFDDLCLSVKASDPRVCYEAYKIMSCACQYPLHLGVTEAGAGLDCLAKSYPVLGGLLLDGIGDTIRVSMTDDPVEEVKAGIRLLRAIGLRHDYVDIVSCPMCGRTEYDIRPIYKALQEATEGIKANLTVAVMGCPLNGIGEAKDADYGVAVGAKGAVLFAKGEQIGFISHEEILPTLLKYVKEACRG